MVSWKRAVLFGLLVWLIPFIVALATAPLKESWRSLFESVMALTLAFVVVTCAIGYWRGVSRVSVNEGVCLGVVWFVICVVIDLPLMLNPPVSYTLTEYMADIGLTYVMIPVITIGMAWAASRCSVEMKS